MSYTNNSAKAPHPAADRLKIGFVLARSFTLSAFALFVDTLRLASDEFDRSGRINADWQVLGSTRHLIASSCGVQVAPTSDFIDPDRFDYIVVVGGLLKVKEPIDLETVRFLKAAAAKDVALIGLCTGSFILAELGLLDDHEACVSWLHYQAFKERFPDLSARSDRLFHLEDKRGSCAGGSSAADIAAALVRRHISKDAERNALEVLQIDKARSETATQARRPFFEHLDESRSVDDPRVAAVLITMEQHLEEGISIGELAKSVSLSRRQLERLIHSKTGLSPAAAFRRLRLDRAKRLLLSSKRPVLEVALDVGFINASHFCKEFKRVHGQTPAQIRDAAVRPREKI